MDLNTIIILSTIVFIIIFLYKEIIHPAMVFVVAISFLVITGILTPKEALLGFSNEQIATIALLLIISKIIQKTKIVEYTFSKFLKRNIGYRNFLGRMMLSVSFSSSFLNNTPIVAMLIPYVYDWGKKKNISPSKLLIPLSYASILGGTATLIGTSTNLVVNGLTIESGLPSLHIFDFAYVGIPAVILGIGYMVLIGHKLLPERKEAISSFLEKKKEYLVETIVGKDSSLIGKTVEKAKLRNLKGLFLVEIIREEDRITPVSPSTILEEGDVLIFAGEVSAVTDLITSDLGLSFPEACKLENYEKTEVVEAVIPANSLLINKRVKDTDFRAKYDAAILAVHRNGERLTGKIGEIVLKPGDLLLVLAGKDFWKRVEDTTDIYVVSKIKEIFNIDIRKGLLIFLSFLIAIFLSALKIIPLFSSLLILIAAFVIFKVATYSEIKRGLDLNLIIIAALSLAIGKSMVSTGVAVHLAELINSVVNPFGVIGSLFGIYIITNILTEFITNVAAASITFPIALASATSLSVEPTAFILAVAYGASASFLTPIGYQTNLMVYGPGGYKFKDFIKAGLPLAVIYMVLCIFILKIIYL